MLYSKCHLWFFLVFVSDSCLGLNFIRQKDSNSSLLAKCKEGLVQGTIKYTGRHNRPYRSFQGIPFAEPPLGELRFREPVASRSWSNFGVLDGSQEKDGCSTTVIFTWLFENMPHNTTEDCLYLNVYTPKKTNEMKLLPVIVWMFGGAFVAGYSNFDFYGPDYYLDKDVVVVTFNYRLGIFGFLSTEDEECPGNMGLKDQLLALSWVKDNIQQFGGDPNLVTISGQSAGASSVHYHMLSPRSKGLFQRAIVQSGTALSHWALQRKPRVVAFKAGFFLGITTQSSKELLDRLRMLDTNVLRLGEDMTLALFLALSGGSDLPFAPVIEPEHSQAFISRSSYEECQKGNFTRVPLLTGVTTEEAGFFQRAYRIVRPFMPLLDAFPTLTLLRDFDFESTSVKRQAVDIVKKKYLPNGKFADATLKEFAKLFSHDNFVRPSIKATQLMSTYIPVYFYQLAYQGRTGLRSLQYNNREVKGVFHAEDLVYLWRRSDLEVSNKADESEIEILTTLWSNFVKYGNPTPSRDPILNNVIWDPVTTPKINHVRIGKHLTKKNEFTDIDMQFWDNVIGMYAKKPYFTY